MMYTYIYIIIIIYLFPLPFFLSSCRCLLPVVGRRLAIVVRRMLLVARRSSLWVCPARSMLGKGRRIASHMNQQCLLYGVHIVV